MGPGHLARVFGPLVDRSPGLRRGHQGALNFAVTFLLVVGAYLVIRPRVAAPLGSAGQQRRRLLEGSGAASEFHSLGLVTTQNAPIASQLCNAFVEDNPSRRVAIVGNGPLSREQRQQLSAAQRIVWFNRLESRPSNLSSAPATDVWFARQRLGGKGDFVWTVPEVKGHVQKPTKLSIKVGQNARLVVLAHNRPTQARIDSLVSNFYKRMKIDRRAANVVALNVTSLEALWQRAAKSILARSGPAVPSTGLIGLLSVLECAPAGFELDIYGFNWSPNNWEGHLMGIEREFVDLAIAASRASVRIHRPPCDGYRHCTS